MTTARYEPVEGKPYGRCETCNTGLASRAASDEHMSTTLAEARASGGDSSHRISVLNPTREERVRSKVRDVVEQAIMAAYEELAELVDDEDVTDEEITAAIASWPEFADAWGEEVLG